MLIAIQAQISAGVVLQTPFLFSGSVRQNVDPSGGHTDAQLLCTLQEVKLLEALTALLPLHATGSARSTLFASREVPSRSISSSASEVSEIREAVSHTAVLDLQLGEGGVSLSQGQQQLLCLARVVLRRSRIVVLDECTANLDPATSATLHSVIAEALSSASVIEVAHQLERIKVCSMAVVMQAGRIVEMGAPGELAATAASFFGGMLQQLIDTQKEERATSKHE